MRHWMMTALLLACATAAASEGPLYLASSIPLAPEADVDPELVADCPFQQDFADFLRHALRGFGAQQAAGALDTARKGRVLQVEIVDLANDGNGFIGHQTYVRLRGTLYQDGRKLASFTSRKQSRGGDFTTTCYKVRSSLQAEAYYIRKWMENPVDGAKLKHIGE